MPAKPTSNMPISPYRAGEPTGKITGGAACHTDVALKTPALQLMVIAGSSWRSLPRPATVDKTQMYRCWTRRVVLVPAGDC